jgi:hypothetical protein
LLEGSLFALPFVCRRQSANSALEGFQSGSWFISEGQSIDEIILSAIVPLGREVLCAIIISLRLVKTIRN